MTPADDKAETQRQWNADPCGAETAAGLEIGGAAFFEKVEIERYEAYAPWLRDVIPFDGFAGQRVLEIGPGLGTDHAQFARAGARMYAVDLTPRHLVLTRQRFAHEKLETHLTRGDAERLPFADRSFDAVYSFGVLHHTSDTATAIEEVRRVLRHGGLAMVSLYHRHSAFHWVATLLCRGVRHGELWRRGYRRLLADIEHGARQSGAQPLVKVLSRRQCRKLFARFSSVTVRSDHVDYCHVFPSRAPTIGVARRRIERLAGRWGWYLTVLARR
jgi:ubiquinone/menaquinone biosynthesis C-methylase UbiE